MANVDPTDSLSRERDSLQRAKQRAGVTPDHQNRLNTSYAAIERSVALLARIEARELAPNTPPHQSLAAAP